MTLATFMQGNTFDLYVMGLQGFNDQKGKIFGQVKAKIGITDTSESLLVNFQPTTLSYPSKCKKKIQKAWNETTLYAFINSTTSDNLFTVTEETTYTSKNNKCTNTLCTQCFVAHTNANNGGSWITSLGTLVNFLKLSVADKTNGSGSKLTLCILNIENQAGQDITAMNRTSDMLEAYTLTQNENCQAFVFLGDFKSGLHCLLPGSKENGEVEDHRPQKKADNDTAYWDPAYPERHPDMLRNISNPNLTYIIPRCKHQPLNIIVDLLDNNVAQYEDELNNILNYDDSSCFEYDSGSWKVQEFKGLREKMIEEVGKIMTYEKNNYYNWTSSEYKPNCNEYEFDKCVLDASSQWWTKPAFNARILVWGATHKWTERNYSLEKPRLIISSKNNKQIVYRNGYFSKYLPVIASIRLDMS